MTTTKTTSGPLAGIQVLDLSRLLPGPFATQLLVDMGALVIKIEAPKGGDYMRHLPPLSKEGTSVLFHAVNRGKKSCALDLKNNAHREQFLTLVDKVDVVVESFRPGVMTKLGLDADTLLHRNPKLVMCSISGYGQQGPHALRAGHDLNYAARAGILGMTSSTANPPVQIADYAGGTWPAVTQILAALIGREKTGKGCHIDIDMTQGARLLLTLPLAAAWMKKSDILPGDNVLAGAVPCYGLYHTADGLLSVGALEPHFWQRFTQVLLAFDENANAQLLENGLARSDEGEAVRHEVQRVLNQRTTQQWMTDFDQTDACVEPVFAPTDDDTHDLPFVMVEAHGEELKLPLTALGIGTPSSRAAPMLGEHNKELL